MTPDDIGSLIRQFCDGELDAPQTAAFEQRMAAEPDLAEQVRFERAFRRSVTRALEAMDDPAPADLAPRIRAALAAAGPAPELKLTADTSADAAAIERAGKSTSDAMTDRRSWLSGHERANIFAVAATITVIAGAVLFGIFGRPIDSIRSTVAEPVTEVAQFVSSEHRRCAGDPDMRSRKLMWQGRDAAAAGLRRHVGCEVPIFDLGGYRFIGGGACHVPGAAPSAHLVYARTEPASDGCPNAMVSIFVVPRDAAGSGFGVGEHWAWAKIGDRPQCQKTVACSEDGSLVYFLVCCNDDEVPSIAKTISRAGRVWRP